MPVGDLPGWHQVFTDDFTVTAPLGSFSGCSTTTSTTSTCSGLPAGVKEKWWAYPDGWHDTTKNGTYYPSKVLSIGNGVLDMYLHTENGVHMVSAPVPRIPGAVGAEGGLLYGRYTMRFKADPLHGYKTAWLLWPDSEIWPQDGEIDFPEGNLDGSFCAYMHHQGGTSGSDQDEYCTSATYTSWHTATIEWLPSSVTFLLDGVVIGKSTSAIPDTPMHMVLQTETSTDGTVPADSTAGHVHVDWFAAYTPTGST
jgi:beta-glucanase (GH16 family)